MKLDISYMRYMTADDFKVLQAVEQGSKNHEVVPTTLIHQLSGMRSMSGTNRSISDLAKLKLIAKLRNAKYDGYRLTYNGIDYLALHSMLNRDTVYSIGGSIGVGKESDIYKVSDKNGVEKVMKIHRLGRTSFHTVRNNRDYLKKISKNGVNWMVLSRLAANKEYQFITMLYAKGFNVPEPFDNSRHIIIMELIKGFPMRRLRKHKNLPQLYNNLMKFIVKLGCSGLIHCDFNEFNIMIKDEDEIDPNDPEEVGFVVIDFPQSISIQHKDAEYYFKRDVDCIRRFFKKKLKYEPKDDPSMLDTDGFGEGYRYAYPDFHRDIERTDNLDELVQASGYSKKHPGDRDLEDAMEDMRNTEETDEDHIEKEEEVEGKEESSDGDDYYYSESEEEESDDGYNSQDEENERIIEALSSGVGNLKMDKMGNYILED
ncbi:Serine kinase [Maudiozyma exigua]|uniref:Serine/threonine-protein kinase RIO2 n=1 Tax=Maudiozyma exigua TaxID=34358 RepID=A0A9P7B347_MAUEX|nr:Serine kinase [Kazachstania exigua]